MLRALTATVLVVLASCQQQPAHQSTQQPVQIRLASWDETQALIAAHKGKIVVLDVWSTWCGPCIEEFPGLVDLHRQHAGRVVCMSLNCNYSGAEGEPPGTDRDQITAFLAQQGATFENVICTDPDEKLYGALGAAAIPIVRVYDRAGNLHKQFDNDDAEFGPEGFTYKQHIAPLVEEMLSQ